MPGQPSIDMREKIEEAIKKYSSINDRIKALNPRDIEGFKALKRIRVDDLGDSYSELSMIESFNQLIPEGPFNISEVQNAHRVYDEKLELFTEVFFKGSELIRNHVDSERDLNILMFDLPMLSFMDLSYSDDMSLRSHYFTGIEEQIKSGYYLKDKPDSKEGEGCFIATYAYGGYDEEEVLILRQYRDEVLNGSVLGKLAVKFYYRLSPRLIRVFRRFKVSPKTVGSILTLVVTYIDNMLKNNSR